MYKVGDKVELWGTRGEIISSERLGSSEYPSNGEPIHTWFYDVSIPITGRWFSIGDKELKPYKSAHEKLIEMGLRLNITKNYADGVFSHEWWNKNDDRVIAFYIDEKVTTVYEGNNEIMAIIPQYLEELEDE